jgi:hypothetical protein
MPPGEAEHPGPAAAAAIFSWHQARVGGYPLFGRLIAARSASCSWDSPMLAPVRAENLVYVMRPGDIR